MLHTLLNYIYQYNSIACIWIQECMCACYKLYSLYYTVQIEVLSNDNHYSIKHTVSNSPAILLQLPYPIQNQVNPQLLLFMQSLVRQQPMPPLAGTQLSLSNSPQHSPMTSSSSALCLSFLQLGVMLDVLLKQL